MRKKSLIVIGIVAVIILAGLYFNLQDKISELSSKLFFLELTKDIYNKAVLNPTEKGYSRLDSNSGFFFIACEDVQPFLDGYRVILNIGNPTTATYSDFKLKVRWGKEFDYKKDKYEEWRKSLREIEKNFSDELKRASWNKVELILTPAKPEEIKYIEVSMTTDEVKLYKYNE